MDTGSLRRCYLKKFRGKRKNFILGENEEGKFKAEQWIKDKMDRIFKICRKMVRNIGNPQPHQVFWATYPSLVNIHHSHMLRKIIIIIQQFSIFHCHPLILLKMLILIYHFSNLFQKCLINNHNLPLLCFYYFFHKRCVWQQQALHSLFILIC